jgi:hypothetical protein
VPEQPEYRQQGTDLPKGSATQLDEALDVAAAAPQAAAAPSQVAVDTSASIDEGEIPDLSQGVEASDPVDDEIFGADSVFPNRPLTHGLPIGPGPDFTTTPRMTDRAILTEAATRILQNRNDVPSGASLFAARVLAGE